jgi:aminopeptidase
MTHAQAVERLARIAVGAGLRTTAGDKVMISGSPIHRDFMLAAARECWKRGAAKVFLRYFDDRGIRDLIEFAPDSSLDEVPSFVRDMFSTLNSERWTQLIADGDEDPAMLDGLDSDRLGRYWAAQGKAKRDFNEALGKFTWPWCAIPCPTDAWARQVLHSDTATAPDLWPLLLDAMRMNGDSEEALIAHCESLAARARWLNGLKLDSLRFTGPGTDLTIGLSQASVWEGGIFTTPEGRRFTANIPTEETCTTPDFHRTEGRVACTRPVVILDQTVEDAWLEFRNGSVVAHGASKNAGTLASFLEIDPGTGRLGEVALVDTESPVWKSQRIYRNTLFDENAACHIALGRGIMSAFEGASGMDVTERDLAGFNESVMHYDLMIGSDQVDVRGRTSSGSEIPLIVKGKFIEA